MWEAACISSCRSSCLSPPSLRGEEKAKTFTCFPLFSQLSGINVCISYDDDDQTNAKTCNKRTLGRTNVRRIVLPLHSTFLTDRHTDSHTSNKPFSLAKKKRGKYRLLPRCICSRKDTVADWGRARGRLCNWDLSQTKDQIKQKTDKKFNLKVPNPIHLGSPRRCRCRQFSFFVWQRNLYVCCCRELRVLQKKQETLTKNSIKS